MSSGKSNCEISQQIEGFDVFSGVIGNVEFQGMRSLRKKRKGNRLNRAVGVPSGFLVFDFFSIQENGCFFVIFQS